MGKSKRETSSNRGRWQELEPEGRVGLSWVKGEREGKKGRKNSRYKTLRQIRAWPLLWKDREQVQHDLCPQAEERVMRSS